MIVISVASEILTSSQLLEILIKSPTFRNTLRKVQEAGDPDEPAVEDAHQCQVIFFLSKPLSSFPKKDVCVLYLLFVHMKSLQTVKK